MADENYEMLWDCPRCDTPKLLGVTHRHCPSCGGPQDATKRYFPPEGEEIAVVDHEFSGADRTCNNCDTPVSRKAEFCHNCGGNMDGEDKDVALVSEATPPEPAAAPPPAKSGGMGMVVMGLGGLLAIAVVVGLLVMMFWTREAGGQVTGHAWERSVQIEAFQTVSADDWCSDMPKGAYSVTKSQKKKSTKQVKDGETCKTVKVDQGDGTFKKKEECKPKYKDEAVMADFCKYKVDEWAEKSWDKNSGSRVSPAPEWPNPKVTDCKKLGCTRVGKKKESYTLKLVEQDDKTSKPTCQLSEKKWAAAKVGAKAVAQIGVTGSVDCSKLKFK